MDNYGFHLNPYFPIREKAGLKAPKKHIIITHKPTSINPNQTLRVRIPQIDDNSVIVGDTFELSFNLNITGSNVKRAIVNNLAKSLVTYCRISIGVHTIQEIHDFDIISLYKDLWLTAEQRHHMIESGIDDEKVINNIRIKQDGSETSANVGQKAVANVYKNRFTIPFNFFEMTKYLPLCNLPEEILFEMQFTPSSSIIIDDSSTPDTEYQLENISLEYDIITNAGYANYVKNSFNHLTIPYVKIHRYSMTDVNQKDSLWNIDINVKSYSLQGILLIFTDDADRMKYAFQNEKFYNPLIQSVDISLDGTPNRLYNRTLDPHHMFSLVKNFMGQKDSDVRIEEFYTKKYALLLDFRTALNNNLYHGGQKLRSTARGVNITIKKQSDTLEDKPIKCYIYCVMDGEISYSNRMISEVSYE